MVDKKKLDNYHIGMDPNSINNTNAVPPPIQPPPAPAPVVLRSKSNLFPMFLLGGIVLVVLSSAAVLFFYSQIPKSTTGQNTQINSAQSATGEVDQKQGKSDLAELPINPEPNDVTYATVAYGVSNVKITSVTTDPAGNFIEVSPLDGSSEIPTLEVGKDVIIKKAGENASINDVVIGQPVSLRLNYDFKTKTWKLLQINLINVAVIDKQ